MRRRWLAAAAAAALLAVAGGAYALAAGPFADVTFAACLNNGKLGQVQVARVPACGPSATPVQWAGQAAISVTPSPSPSPTVTKTWAWCTMSTGEFWPVPDGLFGVWSGEWNSSLPQTVCANSESDWQATFAAPAGNVSILTYPDVQLNYNTAQPLVSGLDPAATATFAEDMHANSGTSAEAAFDVWVAGTGCGSARCEVMIWADTVNRGTVGGATDTGRRGAFCGDPSWQLWQDGAELIWYHPVPEQSGTVCPAAMLQDLQAGGYLPGDAAVSQFEFGWEIASTGGLPETFNVTGYSVAGLPAGN